MALILTVAILDSLTANSYVSRADADIYHEGRLNNTDWTGASDAQKEIALVYATTLLDAGYLWKGFKSGFDQRLEWPRSNVIDDNGFILEHDAIPLQLNRATAELAYSLLKSDREAETSNPGSAGIEKLKIGPIELQFDSETILERIPSNVTILLKGLGSLRTKQLISVPLERV